MPFLPSVTPKLEFCPQCSEAHLPLCYKSSCHPSFGNLAYLKAKDFQTSYIYSLSVRSRPIHLQSPIGVFSLNVLQIPQTHHIRSWGNLFSHYSTLLFLPTPHVSGNGATFHPGLREGSHTRFLSLLLCTITSYCSPNSLNISEIGPHLFLPFATKNFSSTPKLLEPL